LGRSECSKSEATVHPTCEGLFKEWQRKSLSKRLQILEGSFIMHRPCVVDVFLVVVLLLLLVIMLIIVAIINPSPVSSSSKLGTIY